MKTEKPEDIARTRIEICDNTFWLLFWSLALPAVIATIGFAICGVLYMNYWYDSKMADSGLEQVYQVPTGSDDSWLSSRTAEIIWKKPRSKDGKLVEDQTP